MTVLNNSNKRNLSKEIYNTMAKAAKKVVVEEVTVKQQSKQSKLVDKATSRQSLALRMFDAKTKRVKSLSVKTQQGAV